MAPSWLLLYILIFIVFFISNNDFIIFIKTFYTFVVFIDYCTPPRVTSVRWVGVKM